MSSQHLTTTGISFLHTLGTSGFIVDAVEDAGDVDQSLRQPLLVESVTPLGPANGPTENVHKNCHCIGVLSMKTVASGPFEF